MADLLVEPPLLALFRGEEPTILHRFERWVREQPDRLFLFYGEDDLRCSYGEFDRVCNGIAGALRERGVGHGDRVSLFANNSWLALRLMFAAWKLGAVYCPINTRFRGDLLSYIVNDTRPKLLVVEHALLAPLAQVWPDVAEAPLLVQYTPPVGTHDHTAACTAASRDTSLVAGDFAELLEAPAAPTMSIPIEAADLSSIIYTSGTTGNPKGVMHRHAWLHSLCSSLAVLTASDDVVYCDLPFYHIGGAFSMTARAAWAGASVALWDRFSAADFWARIHASGASIALLLDVMSNWIMQQPESPADRQNTLSKVHMQPLPESHHRIAQRFGFDFTICGYGSTEIGNGFTGIVDEFGDAPGTPAQLAKGLDKRQFRQRIRALYGEQAIIDGSQPVPRGFMGVPVGVYAASVLGEDGSVLAPGAPGQLALRPMLPDVLFAAYFNKPHATAEAMRDGLYLSSDIVNRDAGGRFYFHDRKEGFIRVRGENVSASMVEAQILRHAGVAAVAVVGVPAEQGGENDIAAFVVPRTHSALDAAALLEWSAVNLPKFMRPRHVRIVAELPLTPTQKIEKYKLRERILAELATSAGPAASATGARHPR